MHFYFGTRSVSVGRQHARTAEADLYCQSEAGARGALLSKMEMLLRLCATAVARVGTIVLFCVVACRIYFRAIRSNSRRIPLDDPTVGTTNADRLVAFYHPNCAAGGGGERVLWMAMKCLGEMKEAGLQIRVAIYTADAPRSTYKEDVLSHAKERFGINVSPSLPITFVHIDAAKKRIATSRRLSMIAESAGTVRMAWAALQQFTPDVYIDTTGCAFTFLVAKILAGCKVGAYVHYPTISTDMLNLVWTRRPMYNNNAQVASSSVRTYIKLVYYTLFAVCYGAVGSLSDLVMVNSSWTLGHIRFLWRFASRIFVVFPPCDTKSLEDLPLKGREDIIISIGQFRPEKDHQLQLRSFAKLLSQNDDIQKRQVRLVLIGSCRGDDDDARVTELRKLAKELEIEDSVKFVLNQPYSVLRSWLGRASIGIHTMWNEHFGIGVVEMQAAGLITIAHDSGGPKADIIVKTVDGKRTGYLASSVDEYSSAMYKALCGGADSKVNMDIRACGRESSKRFSDQVFMREFKDAVVASEILR